MHLKFDLKINNEFRKLPSNLDDKIGKFLLFAVVDVYNELMNLFRGKKSGKIYKVPAGKARKVKGEFEGGRVYRASAPGEAPAIRTGVYRASWRALSDKINGVWTGILGSTQKYGVCLEYGTSKMRPRPHLKVAFENKKEKIISLAKTMLKVDIRE